MSLEFRATLDDTEFKKKLEDMKNKVSQAVTALQIVSNVVGIHLGATAQLALDMIAMMDMAYHHLVAMYSTTPYLLPFGMLFYAHAMAQRAKATQAVREQEQQMRQELGRLQTMIRLNSLYGG